MAETSRDVSVGSTLECLDVDTGERTVLHTFTEHIEAPNWLHDGRTILYNCDGRLYLLDLETQAVRPLSTGSQVHCNNDHVLSPDQTEVGFSDHTADGGSRVYRVPVEGGEPVLVTPLAPSYLHGWSPDGSTLAYCAQRAGEFDIYTMPAAGGTEQRLTTAPGLSDGPEYSPDGEFIWFNSVRSGLMQLWRMRPDGREQVQMTDDSHSNDWFPHVSPDGYRVAFLAYRQGDVEPASHPPNRAVEIRVMPIHGGTARVVAKVFGGQGTLNVNSWAPDSRRLAFVSYPTP